MKASEVHYILNHLRGISKVMEQDLQHEASKIGLTMAEQHLIWILYFEKEATMTEIGDLGLWDVSTVMQVVKRLKEKGYVKSKKMPHDRRSSYVYLTEKGEDKWKEISNHDYRFSSYLHDLVENDKEFLNFFTQLLTRQKKMNAFFHGEKFVHWVDKTAKVIENRENHE